MWRLPPQPGRHFLSALLTQVLLLFPFACHSWLHLSHRRVQQKFNRSSTEETAHQAAHSPARPTAPGPARCPGVLQGTAVLCVLGAALPSPAPPPLQTPWFPLPFPLNQPTESFINLRKHESKQKEPSAEPKCDLSNLPILSSPGPRYYLSACAESPPLGPHQSLPEAPPQPVLLSPVLSLLLPALLPLVGDARAEPSAHRGDVGTAAAPALRSTAVLEEVARHSSAGLGHDGAQFAA